MSSPASVRMRAPRDANLNDVGASERTALIPPPRDRPVRWEPRPRLTGQPIRADLQRARQIIAESGFSGLFAALKSGVALPAVAFAPLLELLLQAQEGSRQDE